MRSFLLNKLIRDKLLAGMQQNSQQVLFRTLNDDEYLQALTDKLFEEVAEFKAAESAEALKELADVLEVVEALADAIGADHERLRAMQAERRAKRGGFADRIFVERVDLADDDPWVDYYAKEPDRFKEVTDHE